MFKYMADIHMFALNYLKLHVRLKVRKVSLDWQFSSQRIHLSFLARALHFLVVIKMRGFVTMALSLLISFEHFANTCNKTSADTYVNTHSLTVITVFEVCNKRRFTIHVRVYMKYYIEREKEYIPKVGESSFLNLLFATAYLASIKLHYIQNVHMS